MNFLNPMLLAGLALAAVPIVIHLINRKRAVKRPFPMLEFLLRSEKRMAKRLKVKQLLLLASRIAILLLIPLAMAQPYLLSQTGATDDERLPAAVVFVVDDTLSMNQEVAGESSFDLARSVILERVDTLRQWDAVALVLARSPATAPVPELTEDHGELRAWLEEAEAASSRSGSLVEGLRLAAEIHELGQQPVRRTVILTDNTAGAWRTTESIENLGRGLGTVEVIDVMADRPRENVAIVDAGYQESVEASEHD
ncbi:MAG: BatA domain-containing protein, partial [Myxococcales bacterium]|nr:BatA domain-containing protein [Myxococcales bacterium]